MTNTILINSQNLNGLINANLFVEDYNNQLIYISQLTDLFGSGYNSFLIGVKQGSFQMGSMIHVFFADKNGVMIPVTVTQYKQRLMIRCYVQITQQHNIGFGTLVIAGVLTSNKNINVPKNWQGKINIKYQKKIYINPNEKTPSVLRFKNKPTISIEPNEKQLFEYKTEERIETLPITNISIDRNHLNYFCLSINTSSITSSVFYEKKLRYQTVDDISLVTSFDKIFSGSGIYSWLPQQGQYFGDFMSSINSVSFETADIFLYQGLLNLGNVSNSIITRLIGQGVDSFNISRYNYGESSRASSFGEYSIYAENSLNQLSINNLSFYHTGSKIRPIQFISQIQYGKNISLETDYFYGTISSIQGKVFSQQMIISSSIDIYGKYKDLLIKNKDVFPLQKLQFESLLINKQFTHSDSPVNIISTKSTILTNCHISNSYIKNNTSFGIISFDQISGNVYSKQLTTKQQINWDCNSYFSGSLIGTGYFYVKTSGSKLIDYTQSILDSGSYVEMVQGYIFQGQGYNALINVEYFTGSIYSSSLLNKQIYLHQTYSNMQFSKMIIQSQYFDCSMQNIDVLQISSPRAYITPETFNILIWRESSGSYVKLISETPFYVDIPPLSKIHLFGYFNIAKQQVKDVQFNGYYQMSLGHYEIQQYKIVSSQLTQTYQNIFSTRQITFFNNDYSKIYIPIAINSDNVYYNTNSLMELIYSNSIYSLDALFIYQNQLSQPTLIANSDIIPLNIYISNVDIYSGYFNSIQILYNDTLDTQNYQFLSLLEIPRDSVFPITKSIDLPVLSFAGQSTNLLFKPKDSLGRYCPQDYFHTQYNVKLNAQYLLDISKIYNVTYLGGSTVGGSVTSVNNMTGEVMLYAQNIPYNHSVLTNVSLALDYLLIHGGGGSGSVGSVLDLVFSQSIQQFEIGSTQSANVTVSWVYSPRTYPTAIHCYIYSSSYPSQTDWHLATQSILNPTESCIQFQDDLTGSLKVVLEYMFGGSGLDTKSATAYIYFRNSVFLGKSTYVQDLSPLFSSLQNKYLAGDYKTCYTDTITDSKYIYMGFPNHMNTRQPAFVINDIAGGFESSSLVSYTNTSNYTQNYIFYRSVHNNLGYTNLAIKDPIQCLNSITYSSLIVSGGDTPEHNQLQGLQGGSIDQRYHITSDMYSTLSNYSHSELNGVLGAGQYHISLAQYNQLRQYFISLSQPDPNSGSNGDIWLVYQE